MRKLVATLVWCLKAIGFSVVLALLVAAIFHRTAIDLIYKNVEDIVDGEMPPTVVSFPSGPEVVSIIGGSGAGLNCSLPSWANAFFAVGADHKGDRLLVLQRFRQACVFHDLCYRHGLATYGYNQNDCDRVLQNQAFRLCLYIRNDGLPKKDGESDTERRAREATNCQSDSKKVLAGVSLGGFGAYRGWDHSTYYEFDPDPSRSNGFSVARVVRHPFKFAIPGKYIDESDEVILTLDNNRSNLTVNCVTCRQETIQKSTRNPEDASPELRSVGIDTIPQALLTRDLKLNAISPVWLPPRRRHGAPHLLVDSAGKNHLIWMSRNSNENSVFCVVSSDPGQLLTYTLPQSDYCGRSSASKLTMVEPDMLSTSPLPMELPVVEDRIFATSLTTQHKGKNLEFCTRSASRPIDRSERNKKDDQVRCAQLEDKRFFGGSGVGAFQNFVITRSTQQILFVRDIGLPSASFLTQIWQNWLGETYSPGGAMLAFDVVPPSSTFMPAMPTIPKVVPFNIPDRFDPMMPMTRKSDDLRFLALEAPEKLSELSALQSEVRVHVINFANDKPVMDTVRLTQNGATNTDDSLRLHASWALRPVLVLEDKGSNARTRLVFSRGKIAAQAGKFVHPSTNVESLRLEIVMFERDVNSTSDKPFAFSGGASCKVTYTFNPNTDYPCRRAFDPKRSMRSSPAAKMQASQLLVGNFAGPNGYGIAFPDTCLKHTPIILRQNNSTPRQYIEVKKTVGAKTDVEREVVCDALPSKGSMARPIP